MAEVTAIVLAAGEGRRMGGPKALLPFGGATMLEYLLATCRRAGLRRTILVLGAEAERIRRTLSLGDAYVVINEKYTSGQTSSVKVALASLEPSAQGFMLFPVDVPLIRPGLCRKMLSLFRPGRGMIVVPSFAGRRGHPALYDIRYREEFLALGDEEPAHRVIRSHEDAVAYVEAEDDSVLFDVDTPEDYREALRRLEASEES